MTDDVVICDRCKLPHRAPYTIDVFDDDHKPATLHLCEHCIDHYKRIH